MSDRRIFTVTQLNRYVQNVFASDFLLSGLWLKGELSNCRLHPGGNLYFTLKDEDSAVAGIMFKTDVQMLPFVPEDGLDVIVWASVTVYEPTGRYQIIAEMMEPVGIGALALAFEQVKARLQAEGLFDADFKRPLPPSPQRVLVVTSPAGAAVRDIIQISGRRDPSVKITVVPTLVQGEGAVPGIVSALAEANAFGGDLIILGRGGGSLEDLWAFNEEAVARAIFASELPVISAVGHETDYTIADFVADLRAPTPSAAAELAVPNRAAQGEALQEHAARLNRWMQHRLAGAAACLQQQARELTRWAPQLLAREGQRLKYLSGKLEGLSPLAVLARGYALVYQEQAGGLVTRAAQAVPGMGLTIRLQDGEIRAEVVEHEKNREL